MSTNVVSKFEGAVPASELGTPGTVDIEHNLDTEFIASVCVIRHVDKTHIPVTWRTVGPDIVRLIFSTPVIEGEYVISITG